MKKEHNKNNEASSPVKTRFCLSCGAGFPSSGPHHRICDGCKGQRAWSSENPLYACHVPAKTANDNGG